MSEVPLQCVQEGPSRLFEERVWRPQVQGRPQLQDTHRPRSGHMLLGLALR